MKLKYVLAVLIPMTVIDGAWLTFMAPKFYSRYIGHLMAEVPNMWVAGVFYLMYVLGVTYLILMPAIYNKLSKKQVFVNGAILGLLAYGTYDLTNMATLKDWPMIVTVVDMIWGTLLTGTVSLLAYELIRKIIKSE